jgi:hypothetical protein
MEFGQWRSHIQVRVASPGLLEFAHDCTVLILLEPPDILRMNLMIF